MATTSPIIPGHRDHPARQMDPAIQEAARRSDIPDGSLYDTSTVDRTGPGNFYTLLAVLIFVGFLLLAFFFLIH